jgi:hypothetical protein
MSFHSPLERLIESLPQSFPFYHLGEARLRPSSSESAQEIHCEDRSGIAFTLQGEVRGVLALVFDEGLDVSTYSEFGNIIASQMATHLESRHGLTTRISPPRVLTESQLRNFLQQLGPRFARTYLHQHQGHVISIQALVISTEETGHA